MPKRYPDAIHDFGWYGAGYAVCIAGSDDPDFYPPLNDMEAQLEWLTGFIAGWCDCPDDEAIESMLYGDGMAGESLDAALCRAIKDRDALLEQLRAQRAVRDNPQERGHRHHLAAPVRPASWADLKRGSARGSAYLGRSRAPSADTASCQLATGQNHKD